MNAYKAKEKGSQHDPKHVTDKEVNPVGSGLQNMEKRFFIMVDVAALLKQEKAKAPKERFYSRKPPYPLRILSKLYPDRYELRTFAQYDGKKGSVIKHMSKFIDTLGPYAADEDLCLHMVYWLEAKIHPNLG